MPLKNTVAFERRIDLASLFCLIARHGPAVLLALLGCACLVAGFVVFRRARERRRRRRDDRDGQDAARGPWEEEEEPSAGEERRTRSTDASDESSLDEHKEDGNVSHRPLQTVRHRRGTAERKPYKDRLLERDTSVDKAENTFVWDRNSQRATESFTEETRQNLENDYTNKDVIEEVCNPKEPELINDSEDKDKVLETDTSEDITTTNEDVSEEECKQEEDIVQSFFNRQMCFGPTPNLSDTDRKGDNTLQTETKSLEPDFEKIEDSTLSGSKKEEISSQSEDDDNILDQQEKVIEQYTSLQCGEFSVITHLIGKQTSYNHTVEAKEECLISASHNDKLESESYDLTKADTSNDDGNSILDSTNGVNADAPASDMTILSSNSLQQSEASPTLDTEVNQNELCLKETLHHETEVQTNKNQSDSQKAFETVTSDYLEKVSIKIDDHTNSICIAEASHPLEIDTAWAESAGHQEPVETDDFEILALNEEVSLQHQEMVPQEVQDRDQSYEDKLSDRKNSTSNNPTDSEAQSSVADSKSEESFVLLPASPSELTSLSGLTAEAEISNTTVLVPPQISQHENDQKNVSGDIFEASAIICNDMAVCIIKQAVAEVCISEKLQQNTQEAVTDSLQTEENKSLGHPGVHPVQDNDRIDHDNSCSQPTKEHMESVTVQEKSEESVVCSNMAASIIKEKESLSDVQTLEITDEQQSEQKATETLFDQDTDLSNKSESEAGRAQSKMKSEISATTNELEQQCEQKEPEILLDPDTDLSNKSEINEWQGVIVRETFEASVSVVQVFESENVFDNTSHFVPTSSDQISACHYHIDDSKTPAEEAFSVEVIASNSVTTEKAQPEFTSSSEDQQSDCVESIAHFDRTSCAVLDFTQDNDPSMKPLEQIEQKNNGMSSPGVESGISSMTVSPEVEEASKEIGVIVTGDTPLECDSVPLSQDLLTTFKVLHSEEKATLSLLTTEVGFSISKDESNVAIEPLVSSPVQLSPPEDVCCESLVTNEDSFGSEIEDGYQKAMEDFMIQVVDNIMNTSGGTATQTEEKIVKVHVKKDLVCVGTKEEGEKDVELEIEKTEISIMEATMDHNEWIIDGSYQVLPWINVPGFSKDNATSNDTKETDENKAALTPTAEENTEISKKVLAVQPMPQNVNVTFRVHYLPLSPYQTVAVTGDQQELGAWKSVIPLEKSKDGYWSCVVSLPAESHVEWKFVVLDKGEVCRWEECGNRLLYTGYGDDLLVHKWWGFM